ncbi:MAG: hypothetical protein JNL39_00290 [Opitutaceae bacterium]|nr:hypothetical protein [Opitutaceae bacterium]
MVGLALVERGIRDAIAQDEAAEQGERFDGALRLASEPLRMFTEAYARRVTFIRPRAVLDGAAPRTVLANALRTFRTDYVWVIEADDAPRHHVAREGLEPMPLPRLPDAAARPTALGFHFMQGGVLHELSGRRLDRDLRSPGDKPGWFIAARRLDEAALNSPALPIGGEVMVMPPDAPSVAPAGELIYVDRLLTGFDGQPVARLRLVHAAHELASVAAARRARLALMFGFAVVLLGIMVACLWRWVIRPASAMHRSLAAEDPAPLASLVAVGGDYARLAETLRTLLEGRAALRRALAERSQLDRDLHDGVIQSLFASGLSLAQARKLLRSDPVAAERALSEVEDTLNASIREVRVLIEELAPDADEGANFSAAATAVVTRACAGQPSLAATVLIDEPAAVARPLAHRVELLNFIREAASNVVRHARARSLSVSLRPGPDGAARLEIVDDGAGFDPTRVSSGRGLRNLAARATTLGAALAIESAAGRGTRIRLDLPLPAASEAGAS